MTPPANKPVRLAIIGGGFTGAAFAIHALKTASRPVSIDILEPAPELGRGAAYGTDDPVHRINVPSDRMSLFSDDGAHFTRWLFDHGWLPDQRSTDRRGHHYVPRRAFGAYVSDNLKRAYASVSNIAELRVTRSRAISLLRESSGWRVILRDQKSLLVDSAALCTGHTPGTPCPISDAAMRHRGLVAQPWKAGSLAAVGKHDSVLIVGTGLTMADVVASLERAGHKGRITAISRRGLLSRTHGLFTDGVKVFDGKCSSRERDRIAALGSSKHSCSCRQGRLAVCHRRRSGQSADHMAMVAAERARAGCAQTIALLGGSSVSHLASNARGGHTGLRGPAIDD